MVNTSSNITPCYVTCVQGGSLLPPLNNLDCPEVSPYQQMSSRTSFSSSSPPTSFAPNMPEADTLQPGSMHTATSTTAGDDSNTPAWVQMLLEQQAHAHCAMEECNNHPYTHDDHSYACKVQTRVVPQLLIKDRTLKPEEIAIFNLGARDNVKVFCHHIQDIAAFKSQAAICKTLPQCLHSTATDWYTNLGNVEHAQLHVSTDAWQHLLHDHFGMSITKAHSALSSLCYDLAGDYHTYHKHKIHLACIARITIPEQIIQSLFAGLPFDMRNALASSLEGKKAGDLNVFYCCCLPPPHPCQHCNGSHWDADCTKASKPLVRFNPAVAAHHVDATGYEDSDYAALEYHYLEASQAGQPGDLDVDDVLGMTYSPEASSDDSFGSN
ncbi:hypothetical protein NDA12_005447 [Ustilago hordei]|nr:hypothetical protein NDA15_003393 [Ustilago hordei]KAJ1594081.1 hypothetical protein NDA12_005447 [Ustilago hordei]